MCGKFLSSLGPLLFFLFEPSRAIQAGEQGHNLYQFLNDGNYQQAFSKKTFGAIKGNIIFIFESHVAIFFNENFFCWVIQSHSQEIQGTLAGNLH